MFITLEILVEFGRQLVPMALTLGIIILLDFILGVAVALKNGTFQWERLADIYTSYGLKILGWLAIEVLGLLPLEYQAMAGIQQGLAIAAFGLILLSAVGSIFGHIQAIGVLPDLERGSIPPTDKLEPRG